MCVGELCRAKEKGKGNAVGRGKSGGARPPGRYIHYVDGTKLFGRMMRIGITLSSERRKKSGTAGTQEKETDGSRVPGFYRETRAS